ncbi:MAG: hypothetical protein C0404_03500, partial [Verrucomicrobia bacterium]|nr:hypothetical protein [Verrucomicrobiota bacterium]
FMLMGDWYFTATDIQGMVKSHTMFTRLPAAVKMRGIPEPIVALVDAMIRRDPSERPASYETLRAKIVDIIREFLPQKAHNAILKKRRKMFLERFGDAPAEKEPKK